MNEYPFRNLAFQGGGTKALAYHGALRVLEEQGILGPIERVAGTSAGAMTATLLSLRLDVPEIQTVYSEFDVDYFLEAKSGRIPDRTSSPNLLQRELERLQGSFASVTRLATKFGWNSMEYMYVWMQDMLARYCDGDGRATFAQFRGLGFRDLYIVVTNVSTRRTEIFCADRTPDVAVVDALIMSHAIPIFFEGFQFDGREFGQGEHYADGGLLLNYPLPIFDEPAFARDNRWFINGVNWESLGCRAYTPADCPNRHGPIKNLLNYAQSTFEVLLQTQDAAYNLSKSAQRRTINISDCCVNTTDFSVHARWEDPTYRKLVAAGETAAYAFLQEYTRPVIPNQSLLSPLWERLRLTVELWRSGQSRR
jgi:NTE family protein